MSVLTITERKALLAQSSYAKGASSKRQSKGKSPTASNGSGKSRKTGFRSLSAESVLNNNESISLKQLNLIVEQSNSDITNVHLTEVKRLEKETSLIEKDPEHYEQTKFFSNVYIKHSQYYDLLFSIPNGGLRIAGERWRIKAEGQKKGMPDVACLYPTDKYHGLFIELKKPLERFKYKSTAISAVSTEQLEKLSLLRKSGYAAFIAYGEKEAMQIFEAYFSISNNLDSLVLFHPNDF